MFSGSFVFLGFYIFMIILEAHKMQYCTYSLMSSHLYSYFVVVAPLLKKTSSKDLLQQFIDQKQELDGGFDIVDGRIIETNEMEGNAVA